MGCWRCGAVIPRDARYCASCGLEQIRQCPGCGADSLLNARFCAVCGMSLANLAEARRDWVPAPAQATGPYAVEAERRQLTIMFSDLVDIHQPCRASRSRGP